jgi:Putative transposase
MTDDFVRYVTRPAIAEQRLSLANNGNVVVELKSPYDDGPTGTRCRTLF